MKENEERSSEDLESHLSQDGSLEGEREERKETFMCVPPWVTARNKWLT